jgi:hypothetical protein
MFKRMFPNWGQTRPRAVPRLFNRARKKKPDTTVGLCKAPGLSDVYGL